MDYPFDAALDSDTRVFLASLRKNPPMKAPNERLLALIEDGQPNDLKALLHTYAHHSCNGAVGDYWFEQNACRPVDDIPQIEMMEDEQLNGFARSQGIVYSNNAGGEYFLIAMWSPGDTTFRTVKCVAGGYEDDGYFAMEGNVIEVLRGLMYRWAEKDLEVDFEWEDPESLVDEEVLEEFTGGDAALFEVLWKPEWSA